MKELYQSKIRPQLGEQFHYRNAMAVPMVEKIVLNVGLGKNFADKAHQENVANTLSAITGQKAVPTVSKKSISNFKIREGNVIGMKVTLRGKRMYDFLDKLVNISLPRIKDFRGIDERLVDRMGNVTIGFKENIAFPEIKADEIERIHGLQICITSTAGNREAGLALFKAFGFPFKIKATKK